MTETPTDPEQTDDAAHREPSVPPRSTDGGERGGPRSLDGITSFIGMRWENAETVRLTIRPELINRGGLLSGVVTYALVDYCMGSTLWAQTSKNERIATISISINYIQTATEGEVVCRTTLDRRNRTVGILKSIVEADDGRLLCTAIGSYSIRVPPELRG
jgi:uncharacterized protein (TIGR00369 family)